MSCSHSCLLAIFLFLSSAALAREGTGTAEGHGTMRLGLDAGNQETLGPALGLSYRYGLHDFLDRQTGYPAETQVDILSVRLEGFTRGTPVYLDELTAFRFVRLPPLSAQWEELSWKVEVGGRTLRESFCNRCGAANVLAGLGATVHPIGSFPLALWFLVETELLVSPSFSGFPVKPSFGPRVGLRFPIRSWLNGMVYGAYRYQVATGSTDLVQAGTEWRVALGQDWALNAKIQRLSDGWQGTCGVFAYF